MKLCPKFIVALFIVGSSFSSALGPKRAVNSKKAKFEIKKFRFAEHRGQEYERLVVQLKRKGGASGNPKIVIKQKAREAHLTIAGANMVGAVPEAQINESYSRKSRFLGPVSIDTDDPKKGVKVKVFLKSNLKVDAFWLNSPTRLVIDAYPKNSIRAKNGRKASSSRRGLASKAAPNYSQSQKQFIKNVICFPEGAQLDLTISFQSKLPTVETSKGKKKAKKKKKKDGHTGGKPICYSRKMEIVPNIGFHASQEKDLSLKRSLLPTLPENSPWAKKKGGGFNQILPGQQQPGAPGPRLPASNPGNRSIGPAGPAGPTSSPAFRPGGPQVNPGQPLGRPGFGQSSPLPGANSGFRPGGAAGGPRSLASPGVGGFRPGGAAPGGFRPGGAAPGGFRPGGAAPGGFRPGGAAPGGFRPGGAAPGGFRPGGAAPGGFRPGGAAPRFGR